MNLRGLLCLLIVLLCCGCEAERFPIAPASGQVLFDGKPLSGAHVLFQPVPKGTEVEAGPESVGRTDADGRFTLSTIAPERSGAMIGTHRVSVTIIEEEQRYGGSGDAGFTGPRKYTLPERYRLGTELKIEVPPGGTDKLELKLTSP
jgi:hypothetical protein